MTRELTGRHVLIVTLSAFGVVIAVNVAMAFLAIGSFPGLEVPNSYVASQRFDRERQAQQALGWTATVGHDGADLVVDIVDGQGDHPALSHFTATVGRPTHGKSNITPQFRSVGGSYRTPLDLDPGIWTIHVAAIAPDGTAFRQRLNIHMPAEEE